MKTLLNWLSKLGISPASWGASSFDYRLAIFRIAFGGVLTYYFGELCFTGKGEHYLVDTIYLIRYPGFEWIPVIPDSLMMPWLYFGLACAVAFTLGVAYRISSALLSFAFIYTWLLDISHWNNHYYFYAMVSVVMALSNSGNRLSLDALFWPDKQQCNRGWELWTLRFIVGIVFFYGGVSKLSNQEWLSNASVSSIYQHSFERLNIHVTQDTFNLISWTVSLFGLVFDLIVPFLLIAKNPRIRVLALVFYIPFNIANAMLLRIGTFPYALLGAISIYLHPAWLKRLSVEPKDQNIYNMSPWSKLVLWSFVVFQLLFPLRHWLIEGNMFWTNEGKLYGWFMMSGTLQVTCNEFYLVEHNEQDEPVATSTIQTSDFMDARQKRALGHWPMTIPRFARFLKSEAELTGMKKVKVYSDVLVSRNGKEARHIVPPNVDLASLNVSRFKHNDWILLYAQEGF